MLAPPAFSKLVSSEFPWKLSVSLYTQWQKFKTWTSSFCLLLKYWLSHCFSFYILIPPQIPYYILKDILFVFWNFHEAQYFAKYLESHHGFLLHNSMWKNNFVKCNRYTALEQCKQWKHKMQNLFLLETRKKITWQ